MEKYKLWYLASPYSYIPNGDEGDKLNEIKKKVMEERYLIVQKAAIDLMRVDVFAFSPIAYNHPMADVEALPTDFAFWEAYDKAFVQKSDGVIVLTIPGWQDSVGVAEEIKYAGQLGLKVVYASPENILDQSVLNELKK